MKALLTLVLVLSCLACAGQDLSTNKKARKEANKFARRHLISPKAKRWFVVGVFITVAATPVVMNEFNRLKNQNK